jgi:membrane fusion protein (multidrug efflux system)
MALLEIWSKRPFSQYSRSLAAGCSLALLLLSGCGEKADEKSAGPAGPAPAVVVAPVVQQNVPLYSEFVARTQAKETVELRARVEGFLEKMLFKEGTVVKKGQVLYVIDRRPYEAKLDSAKAHLAISRAAVDQAKAKLNKAQKDVARLTPLAREKAVPEQDLDTALAQEQVAQADLVQAKAAVESAKAAVVQAELDLSYCTIRAPFDGLIGRTQVDVGNLVGRGEPTLLNTVSLVDPMWVSFAIPEASYLEFMKRRDQRGERDSPDIELILADNSVFPHLGKFVIAERAVDIKTGTLNLVAEFPNPEGIIRPNQFARARFAAEEAKDALLVPQRAVMEQQGVSVVYVVLPDNKVALRTVTLGERYQNSVIVNEGATKGERVVVEGLLKVRPGMVVTPTDKPLTEEKQKG